jgi:hypothetical protein
MKRFNLAKEKHSPIIQEGFELQDNIAGYYMVTV